MVKFEDCRQRRSGNVTLLIDPCGWLAGVIYEGKIYPAWQLEVDCTERYDILYSDEGDPFGLYRPGRGIIWFDF